MNLLSEIYYSIKQNRSRVLLSGFGISWGILILILLLGVGSGFQNSVMNMFSAFAKKCIYVYGGSTSKKYHNLSLDRSIKFDDKYLSDIKKRFSAIDAISAEVSGFFTVKYGQKSGTFLVFGVESDYMQIKILEVGKEGRNINCVDVTKNRNVAVIGQNIINKLSPNGKGLLNEWIDINGVSYKVIGVLKNENIFSASEINSVYIPITSYRRGVDNAIEYSTFFLALKNNSDSKLFESELREFMAYKSQFVADDVQALYISNFETQTSSFDSLFKGLKIFIWAIGVCFLVSGIVGISNIMFVSVKERTNEIGIRLAVGASPRSIMNLILLESVIVTSLSGITGLFLGKMGLSLIDWLLLMSDDGILIEKTMFDLSVAIVALIVLIIAGILAGTVPAIVAARIEPVEAIRYENRN